MHCRLIIALLLVSMLAGCRSRSAAWEIHAQRVEQAYGCMKATSQLPDSIDLEQEADWLLAHRRARYAGEAYYILGAYENLIGRDSVAMGYLKKAEACWMEATDAPAVLVGMTYYKQGRVSENEMLSEVALYHYREALPYLLQAGDSLYLTCVYRDMARMTTDTAEQRLLFEQALLYAESLSESLQLDTRYAMLSSLSPQSEERLRISEQLSRISGMQRYAVDEVRAALGAHDMVRAAQQLQVLAQDTAAQPWSKYQYALLRARYLFMQGNSVDAYAVMEGLYAQRMAQWQMDGAARSYAIAERYDNAAERRKNASLQEQKNALHRVIMWGLIGLLVAMMVLFVVWFVRRELRRQEQQRMEAHIASLRASVTAKNDQLKLLLLQRIAHAQKLTNIFAKEQDWLDFRTAFDSVYDGWLVRMEHDYPALTTADEQLITLMVLGLDSSEICLLLNLTKQSIWNRKQRINEHMRRSDSKSSLDELIRQIVPLFLLIAVITGATGCAKEHEPDITMPIVDTIVPPYNPPVISEPFSPDSLKEMRRRRKDFYNYKLEKKYEKTILDTVAGGRYPRYGTAIGLIRTSATQNTTAAAE